MEIRHTRRQCLGLLGLGLLSSTWASAGEGGFLNLMPAFWAVHDAGLGLPLDDRALKLVEHFFEPNADLYRRAGLASKTRLDAALIARWLKVFDRMSSDVRAVSVDFPRGYDAHLASFRRGVPDFDLAASPVAFMPSLLHFDAHLEPDGKVLPLFFAPDGIVKYHGASADLAVLFSHEMFHCYQAQRNPALMLDPSPPFYVQLWVEGTATYASERLNPRASTLHVLLDDAKLAALGPAILKKAARTALDQLDSTDEALMNAFFSTGNVGSPWPDRIGYDLGLRVFRRIGAGRTLRQIASMPAVAMREAVAGALNDLAS